MKGRGPAYKRRGRGWGRGPRLSGHKAPRAAARCPPSGPARSPPLPAPGTGFGAPGRAREPCPRSRAAPAAAAGSRPGAETEPGSCAWGARRQGRRAGLGAPKESPGPVLGGLSGPGPELRKGVQSCAWGLDTRVTEPVWGLWKGDRGLRLGGCKPRASAVCWGLETGVTRTALGLRL